MSIRKKTLAELQAESRLRQERLREQARTKKQLQQQQAYKRKRQMQEHLAQLELQEKVKKERLQDKELRAIENRFWMNEDDTELYTLEELMNIERLYPNEKGRINWFKFNELVMKGKENATKTIK